MKKWSLPPLSRGKKVVRNLLFALLLLIFAWGCIGFQIGDPYRSFRRAEGEGWVGPADYQGDFHTTWDGWAVGTYQDQVLLHLEDYRWFEYWPRSEEGATLLPVPEDRLLEGESWFVAVDVPEGTTSAKLELTLSAYYTENHTPNGVGRQICATLDIPGGQWQYGQPKRWERTYVVEGERLDEGGVLFHVTPQEADDRSIERMMLSYSYEWEIYNREDPAYRAINCLGEAIFYDANDNELGRAVLTTQN